MLLRLQNSLASMRSMIREQERIANNLANANTVGYKRDRLFTEALNEHLDEEGAPQSSRIVTQWADLRAGALDETGNPLDVAIDGEGFFAVTDEATGATRYTRDGRLTVDADGLLRTASGFLLEGEAGPIQVPTAGEAIEISKNGEVRAGGEPVGRLRLVTFADPTALRRLDGVTFAAEGQEPEPVEQPNVLQGFVEGSNVDPVHEMTDMITYFRQFETQQKLMQTTDHLLGSITRELGKF